jgi:hypothetical protein
MEHIAVLMSIRSDKKFMYIYIIQNNILMWNSKWATECHGWVLLA